MNLLFTPCYSERIRKKIQRLEVSEGNGQSQVSVIGYIAQRYENTLQIESFGDFRSANTNVVGKKIGVRGNT